MPGLEQLRRQYEDSDTLLFHYLHRVQDSISTRPGCESWAGVNGA